MAIAQVFDPFDAADKGWEAGRRRRQQDAQTNAFMLAGSGDTEGAANAFLRSGAPDQAAAVLNLSASRKERGRQERVRQALAGGDTPGARRAAEGDAEILSKLDGLDANTRKIAADNADLAWGILERLKSVPQEQRAGALANAAPYLQQRGFSAEQISSAQQNLSDAGINQMQVGFDVVRTHAKKEPYTLSQGQVRYDENNRVVAEGPQQPDEGVVVGGDLVGKRSGRPMYYGARSEKIGPGEQVFASPGQPASGQQPAPMGQPGGGQAAPRSPSLINTGATGGTRAVRNNNPLNLTTLPNGQQWNGQTGADDRFATFGSPEQGFAAADRNLQTYATKYGIDTLSGVISRWAPSSENDTAAYVATVAKDLGIDPNQRLNLADPQVRRTVLDAMAKVEGGGSPARAQAAGQQTNAFLAPQAGAQAGGPPQMRLVAQGQPKPAKEVVNATPEQLRAAGYPAGSRAQIDLSTGEMKNIKQPNEGQTKATGYAKRVLDANDQMNSLAEAGIVRPTAQVFISDRNGVTKWAFRNQNDRRFVQAASNWLAPILRKDTGAAVTPQEFETYSQIYIPLPGDDEGTLRQKAEARHSAMQALVGETGGLYDATYGARKYSVRFPGKGGGATRGGKQGAAQPIIAPPEAIAELKRDASGPARREFDEVFGQGAAARALAVR